MDAEPFLTVFLEEREGKTLGGQRKESKSDEYPKRQEDTEIKY